jgi:hypothetical protein
MRWRALRRNTDETTVSADETVISGSLRGEANPGQPIEGRTPVKLYVDTSNKQVTVSKEAVEKVEQNGRQKQERGTGRLMWSTQVFVLDDDGGEVISVTTAGERPNVKVGQLVIVSSLEALPWATNGRNGVAFRATEIKAAGAPSVKAQ